MANISEALTANGGDIQSLRPWLDENGKSWITKNGEVIPSEIVGLCTKEDFIDLDVLTLISATYHFRATHVLRSYGGGLLGLILIIVLVLVLLGHI